MKTTCTVKIRFEAYIFWIYVSGTDMLWKTTHQEKANCAIKNASHGFMGLAQCSIMESHTNRTYVVM